MERDGYLFGTPATGHRSGILSPITDLERATFATGRPGWFHKELIRESTYVHPIMGWSLEVTPKKLRAWAAAFEAMSGNGHEIPVPDGHVFTSVLANQGFLREVYVAENEDATLSLFGWVEILKSQAAEGIRDGTINHVSVALGKNVKDGLGVAYGEAIEHVCLTNYPVAHNTGPFAEAAYALAGDPGEGQVFLFSTQAAPRTLAVSDAPWSPMATSTLPSSAFLHVGDPEDPATWKLPVFEGSGPVVEAEGGRKERKGRGPLNRGAVHAAVAALQDLPEGVREKAARKLSGLFRQIGEEPPAALRASPESSALGVFSFAVSGEVVEIPIPRLRDAVKEEETRERVNRAIWSFRDIVERVAASDSITAAEKRKKLTEAIADLQDILAPEVRADLLAAVLGPEGLNLQKENHPMDEKLLALCAALGISVADPKAAPTPEFVAQVYAKAHEAAMARTALTTQVETITADRDRLQAAVKASGEDEATRFATKAAADPDFAALLSAKKAADEEAQKLRRASQKDSLGKNLALVENLLATGTITEKAAVAARKLLGVQVLAMGLQFSTKDGKPNPEALEATEVDVPSAVRDLLASLPEGASLDMKERTARHAGRRLHSVESVKEDEDAQKKADVVATENLMLIGQPVPSPLLSRLPEDWKKKAEEFNRGLNGSATR